MPKKKEGKKIVVDKDVCIGCGACIAAAPDYFEFDDEGKSQVKKQYDKSDADTIQDAVDGCPVDAIEITTVETE